MLNAVAIPLDLCRNIYPLQGLAKRQYFILHFGILIAERSSKNGNNESDTVNIQNYYDIYDDARFEHANDISCVVVVHMTAFII